MRHLILSFWLISAYCWAQQEKFAHQLQQLLYDARYDEILELTASYSENKPDYNKVLNIRAEALILLQKHAEAEQLLAKELQRTASAEERGNTLATSGFLYLNQGRTDKAMEALQQALSLLENAGPLLRARTLAFLGQLYNSTGKYAQAEEQLQVALSLRASVLPENHEEIAASYNDLGLTATVTDPEKALNYFDKALEIYHLLHGNEHPKIANTLTNAGIAYRILQLYGDATVNFEEALHIWNNVFSRPHPSKAFVISNLGETAAATGNLEAALKYFEQALAIYNQVYGSKHPDIARIYILIGQIKLSQNKYTEALQSYQQAIIANTSGFGNENPVVNPDGKNFYNGYQLLYAQMRKAQAFEAQYYGKTLRQSHLETALRQLMQCDSLIDRLRQQTSLETDKIALGGIANEVYADGVRIGYELSQVAFRNRRYFREISFYFAEKSKSAVLLDAISDANAKAFAGLPPEILEEEKNLKSALTLIYQKLAQKPAEPEEKYLRETAFELNLAYSKFVSNVERQYPEYFNLKFNTTAPSIGRLQQQLSDDTAVLSYFIDDHNNRKQLYIYVITSKTFFIKSRSLPAAFDKIITGYRNSMYYLDKEQFVRFSQTLYSLLIPSIPNRIRSLVILPAGRLSIIPFEPLLAGRVKSNNTPYSRLPYLITRFDIRYEFSAGLILQKKSGQVPPPDSVALCAPVNFPDMPGLPELPGSQQEVEQLSKLFAQNNVSTQVLLSSQANEATFKNQHLQNYSIIHLATHGVVNEENPELSCIYLYPHSGSEDGSLYTGEIYNLQLKANLVALSACQTGLGKITRGEGVIGLSRALVYAGAQNLLVSFWSVADESTALFMGDFYRHALSQKPIHFARSLQKTKKQMTQGTYAAPFYWAPFVLIGY
ncbi:MAG: tetratricopeptide repeat domain protein [Cyclobacteriaceae bacterium]|nr:MAG: tetratricopeptide repeat domain protein [Cyclobacteriaceae bacterium]